MAVKTGQREALWQGAVVALLLDRLGHEGPAKLLDFSFASEDPERAATIRVAKVSLPCDDGSELVLSSALGLAGREDRAADASRRVFLGLYASNSVALAELVAASLHFHLFVEGLDVGHTFPLGRHSSLRRVGYQGALVLGGELYRPFKDVPAVIGGVPTVFLSVHPLTGDELSFKRERGLEKLMSRWRDERKDYLSIRERESRRGQA